MSDTTRKDAECCGTCRFHDSHRKGWNLCQRRAPSMASGADDLDQFTGIWPETMPDDWCGEYETIHCEEASE